MLNKTPLQGGSGTNSGLLPGKFANLAFFGLSSADCKKGRRKGATSKNVKNRQKVSKSFSTLFDNFRAGQKTSKIVKKCQKYFRHFSTIFARHHFSGPFWGALMSGANKAREEFQHKELWRPLPEILSFILRGKEAPNKEFEGSGVWDGVSGEILYVYALLRGLSLVCQDYPAPQKHYIHKSLGEFIFGSLHIFHVIHCASRNCTWKTNIFCVVDGVGHYIENKIYVMRCRPLHKVILGGH